MPAEWLEIQVPAKICSRQEKYKVTANSIQRVTCQLKGERGSVPEYKYPGLARRVRLMMVESTTALTHSRHSVILDG